MPLLPTVRRYQATDPYHHVEDNIPIDDLTDQITIVNAAVDTNTTVLVDAAGTQGTVGNRLDQSTDSDGNLKTAAIDTALHSIEEHTDTSSYVRMTAAERTKLTGIAVNAKDITFQVTEPDTTVTNFTSGTIKFKGSDSIEWRIESGNEVYADITFPIDSRHRHYYNLAPIHKTPLTPDYKNYYTTNSHQVYAEDSLRVYVNGYRINKYDGTNKTRVPRVSGQTATWFDVAYTEAAATSSVVTTGDFALTDAITSSDKIYIDFDVTLT